MRVEAKSNNTQLDVAGAENMSGSLLGFYIFSVASIIAAPFTSLWVPVVVIGFYGGVYFNFLNYQHNPSW